MEQVVLGSSKQWRVCTCSISVSFSSNSARAIASRLLHKSLQSVSTGLMRGCDEKPWHVVGSIRSRR